MHHLLIALLAGLTPEQKSDLEALDIPKSRLSEWKAGKRKPTAAQMATLASVLKIDPAPLLIALAQAEATESQRRALESRPMGLEDAKDES